MGSGFFGGSGHFYWFFPVFLKNYIDMLAILTSLKCYAKCWGWNPTDVVPIETERFQGWELIYPNEPCHAVDFSYPACSIAPKCNTLRNVSGWSAPNLALAICVPRPLHLLFLLEGFGVAINFRFQHFGHEKSTRRYSSLISPCSWNDFDKKTKNGLVNKKIRRKLCSQIGERKKNNKKYQHFPPPPKKKNNGNPKRHLPTHQQNPPHQKILTGRWAWNLPLPAVSRVQLQDIAPWPGVRSLKTGSIHHGSYGLYWLI